MIYWYGTWYGTNNHLPWINHLSMGALPLSPPQLYECWRFYHSILYQYILWNIQQLISPCGILQSMIILYSKKLNLSWLIYGINNKKKIIYRPMIHSYASLFNILSPIFFFIILFCVSLTVNSTLICLLKSWPWYIMINSLAGM